MVKQSKSSNKKFVDVVVECVYESKKVKAYRVDIKEGIFLVIDYTDRSVSKRDTEVYWDRYIQVIPDHNNEYKLADKAVTDFLKQKSKQKNG
jgi:hypothetical protein